MAIYHLSVKPISRSGGRSATAAAAYRSGELVHDLTSDEVFDYTRKRGVEHSEIVLPTAAAQQDINWARDRQALWNAAEQCENRSNSRVAREYELALPHELTHAQRVELVRGFAAEIANRHGVAVDFAIHAPHRSGDERNHHAHLMATTRVLEADGLGAKSEIEWSDSNRRKAGLESGKHEIAAVRGLWAQLTNEKLHAQGHDIRVDHRSLEAQGIEREPGSHLGVAVSGMERRGIETEVGKRIASEQEAALERLQQAAAWGQRERNQELALSTSMLSVSSDLESAKRERDQMLQKQSDQSRESSHAKVPSIEELQREGREQWLAFRAEQKLKEAAAEQKPEQARGSEKAAALSLDEERRQAAQRWLDYRAMTPEQRQAHDEAQAQEHGHQKGHDHGQEID